MDWFALYILIPVGLLVVVAYQVGRNKEQESQELAKHELREEAGRQRAIARLRIREACTAMFKAKQSRKQLIKLGIIIVRRAPHTNCRPTADVKCNCWKADALAVIREEAKDA